MPRYYLDVPFKEKDEAKRLGARFDWDQRRWYVSEGTDLTLFSRWWPAELHQGQQTSLQSTPLVDAGAEGELALLKSEHGTLESARPQGISLSQLLRGIAHAVEGVYSDGVWAVVEVVEAHLRGHVYLEVSERSPEGLPIAKARAIIWESTAARILPEFEKSTGMMLGAGMKVLLRVRPTFHAQYGFSLQIEAIDAQYSLGLLEARRREIRSRLQREGIYQNNRRLDPPWDYHAVLVVAPPKGAGLGDFKKEAERLASFGVCQFYYCYSRFQGEGAARDIIDAVQSALQSHKRLDALVLIRGGGAVSDLAWLDDYDLVRFLCELPIPVMTGIGHERDKTLADEVANLAFDTPSKVIAGIEQRIMQRVREAHQAAEHVFAQAESALHSARQMTHQHQQQIRAEAQAHVYRAREGSGTVFSCIGRDAALQLHRARLLSGQSMDDIRADARQQVARAQQHVPSLWHSIASTSRYWLTGADRRVGLARQTVLDHAGGGCRAARLALHVEGQRLHERVQRALQKAKEGSEGLFREIMGQGPKKTLARGFAIVRSSAGKPVTSSARACQLASLDIEFSDGRVRVERPQKSGTPDHDEFS